MSTSGFHEEASNLDVDLFKFTDFVSNYTSLPSRNFLGHCSNSMFFSGDSLKSENVSVGTSFGSVAAAAHLAALFNRSSCRKHTEMPSNQARRNIKSASCHACISKSPVSSFCISPTSSQTTFPRKRKAEEQNVTNIDEDNDVQPTSARIVTTGVRAPPKASRLIKRQRLCDVQRKILSATVSPCEKLKSMAQDLRSGVITKQQAKLITRYVIKDAKRTEEGWRRVGVDCSPNRLVSICREEPCLEWMFD